MNFYSLPDAANRLDMELCRAMYEKDPDKLLELVSEWLEINRLAPSDDFQVPAYLEAVLNGAEENTPYGRHLRVLVS